MKGEKNICLRKTGSKHGPVYLQCPGIPRAGNRRRRGCQQGFLSSQKNIIRDSSLDQEGSPWTGSVSPHCPRIKIRCWRSSPGIVQKNFSPFSPLPSHGACRTFQGLRKNPQGLLPARGRRYTFDSNTQFRDYRGRRHTSGRGGHQGRLPLK